MMGWDRPGPFTPSERYAACVIWTAICWFGSMRYLGAGVCVSVLMAQFVLVSMTLGLGTHLIFRIGVALPILAVMVAIGFPPPSEWGNAVVHIPEFLARVKNALLG